MPDIATKEPTEVVSGDTIQWRREDISDYPATLWTLKYHLRGPSQIEITASADGANFAITVTAADSATWNPGTYAWEAYVYDIAATGLRHKVPGASGRIEVTKNYAEADDVYDPRTVNEIILDNVNAVLSNSATLQQLAYSIGGRSLSRHSLTELRALKNEYEIKVRKDRGQKTGTIKVRF